LSSVPIPFDEAVCPLKSGTLLLPHFHPRGGVLNGKYYVQLWDLAKNISYMSRPQQPESNDDQNYWAFLISTVDPDFMFNSAQMKHLCAPKYKPFSLDM
jgi:hypothetical protein